MEPAMSFPEISGEVLWRRLAMGLTQAELAARAGLSRATVNAIENDTVPDIGARKLAGLLEVLGGVMGIAGMPLVSASALPSGSRRDAGAPRPPE